MSRFMGYFTVLNGLADSGDDYLRSLMGAKNCAEIARMQVVYANLARKSGKTPATIANAKRLASAYAAGSVQCRTLQAMAAAPPKITTPAIVEPPAPVVQPYQPPVVPPVVSPGNVLTEGGNQPSPPPQDQNPVMGPPNATPECELSSKGLLPMQYSDSFGPMSVLAVYCNVNSAVKQLSGWRW